MKELSKLEEVVMIAVWRLKDDAYGVRIKKLVSELTGRDYLYNTLYTSFEQLIRKEYLTKHFSEPEAVRGGKRKVFFNLTDTGVKALQTAWERQEKIWTGITEESFTGEVVK